VDTIIGLGNAGCNIADMFAQYSQYLTYKLDVGLEKTKTTFPLDMHQKIENYEEKTPNLQYFFRGLRGDILFVVGGGGKVSSASLAILKHLKNKCNINILYIKPEPTLLNETQFKLEKMVYNVLQEYTRSGVFSKMFIISNEEVENLLGNLTVKNYYNKINEMVVSAIHMINIFKNSISINDTFCELPIGARIITIGMVDLENEENKMFFSLDNVSDMVYYCAYNKRKIESDSSLMKKIKTMINKQKENGVRVTYGIFETDYKQDYIYCMNYASVIQN